jgi:hypothetical protein
MHEPKPILLFSSVSNFKLLTRSDFFNYLGNLEEFLKYKYKMFLVDYYRDLEPRLWYQL